MWRILILFLVIKLFSCKTEEETKTDVLKKLFHTSHQLDSALTALYESKQENKVLIRQMLRLKKNNDKLIEITLNYKEEKIKSYYEKDKMIEVLSEKDMLFKQTKKLQNNYQELAIENRGIKDTLKNERQINRSIIKEKKQLEETLLTASELSITSVNITGLTRPFITFGKKKEIETNKTKKIQKVKVSFSIPENTIAEEGKNNIAVVMYSKDSYDKIRKDTSVFYNKKEQKVNLLLYGKEFIAGDHLIEISINGKIKHKDIYTIVNN